MDLLLQQLMGALRYNGFSRMYWFYSRGILSFTIFGNRTTPNQKS